MNPPRRHEEREKQRLRFEHEAQIASALVHENLVNTYDRGRDDRVGYWFVMELLDGEDLHQHLASWSSNHPDTPFPARRTGELLNAVCDGLAALHRIGVVHRDLKPSNVFLSRADGEDEHTVKLMDFGIAVEPSCDEAFFTRQGALMGTVPFMGPDIIDGNHKLTGKYDVYALGCVLYYMLTGEYPHLTSCDIHPFALLDLRSKKLPDMGKLPPGRRLRALMKKALHPKPRRRYSVSEFKNSLARAIDVDADRWR